MLHSPDKHYHLHHKRQKQGKKLFRLASLCFLLFFVSSCGFSTNSGNSSDHLTVQQGPHAKITYVAIGASDTYGTGTSDPRTESWPSRLAGKLGNSVHLINLGIPGMHLHEALKVELPVALDNQPDVITIWLAVNDLVDNVPLDRYERDLELLLSRLEKAAPKARIAVANVPDLTLLPRFKDMDETDLHERIAAYNDRIVRVVARHSVALIDLSQQWDELSQNPDYISGDGFHPSALGYLRLADIFYQVLQTHA